MSRVVSSVKALVEWEGKFLFLEERLRKTVWDLPGGKIEYGENPYEALLREVKEETMLDVEIVRPVGMWWFISMRRKHHVICNTFLCRMKDETQKIDLGQNPADEEIEAYHWLSVDEVLEQHEGKLAESLVELLRKMGR